MILWIKASGKRPNDQRARLVSFVHQKAVSSGLRLMPKIRVQFQGDGKYGIRRLKDVCGVELAEGMTLWFHRLGYPAVFVPKTCRYS